MADEPQGISTYTVTPEGAGARLDVFLAAHVGGVSRAKLQKIIALGHITVNGRAARGKDVVSVGDQIHVTWPAPPPSRILPVAMPLAILYEDAAIIVIAKPPGLTVHPGAGDTGPTLVQGLLYHCGQLGKSAARDGYIDPSAWARPGIVHRLDKDTSGVMVCAKTDKAHAALAQQFHDRSTLRRTYTALLDGVLASPPSTVLGQLKEFPRRTLQEQPAAAQGLPSEVIFASYLRRDPAQRLRMMSISVGEYEELKNSGRLARTLPTQPKSWRYSKSSFVRTATYGQRLCLATVRLFTGRTHQIRVHAKALGLPVVGDQVYGRPLQLPQSFPPAVRAALAGVSRQMLHAASLGFVHPATGAEVSFSAPPPDDFISIINILSSFKGAD